jgi:hypothetical protein
MRVAFLCAAAALFFIGCSSNTVEVPADSKAQAKADTKKNDPPPETRKDSATSGKAAEPWGTITGRVTWGAKDLPNPPPVTVTADVAHCTSKGPIPDETWIVNKENKGVKNVFVWLIDASNPKAKLPIHPSLKEPKDKEVVMDQPCCKFEPRALALREGQVLVAKNSSPIGHNFNYVGEKDGNNRLIPAGGKWDITLAASERPINVSCNIHGWMKADIRVFDHPYFALTDADGKFEIKNAPAGKYKIVMWHAECGWVNGGKTGKLVEIKAGDRTEVSETAPPAE